MAYTDENDQVLTDEQLRSILRETYKYDNAIQSIRFGKHYAECIGYPDVDRMDIDNVIQCLIRVGVYVNKHQRIIPFYPIHS